MIVTVLRSPTACAASMTSSHWPVLILSGQITARTSSSRISAAVPGSELSPAVLQLAQEIGDRTAERLGALPDFERREGVDVDVGHRFFDCPADCEIGGAGVFRMDAALQAYLGRAAAPSFLDPPLDLGDIEVVGPAAQVFAELPLRERAELAAEIADVGVVDVTGHDVADRVPIDPLPQLVGCPAHRIEIPPCAPRRGGRCQPRRAFRRRMPDREGRTSMPLTHPPCALGPPLPQCGRGCRAERGG